MCSNCTVVGLDSRRRQRFSLTAPSQLIRWMWEGGLFFVDPHYGLFDAAFIVAIL